MREAEKPATHVRILEPTSFMCVWRDLEGMVDLQQAERGERLLGEETQKGVEARNTSIVEKGRGVVCLRWERGAQTRGRKLSQTEKV